MDPLTHGLLGASCACALLPIKEKNKTLLAGALAGMAPDLDIFIQSAQNPMLMFLYHRHFSHSLIFIPLGALLVTFFLLLFKRFRGDLVLVCLAVLIGYATHGLLDACTNYGTLLFWPFSYVRVRWDVLSIIDPFITIPLALGVVATVQFNTKKGIGVAFFAVMIMLVLNVLQHHRAIHAIHNEASNKQWPLTKIEAYPKLASSTAWRGIAQLKQRYALIFDIDVPLLKATTITLRRIYPLYSAEKLPLFVKDSPTLLNDFKIFNWFSDGYLIQNKQNTLSLADGRFLSDRNPSIALWNIQFLPGEKHVKKLNFLPINNRH